MSELFDRYIAATVGTRRITGLRMAFRVGKPGNKPEPNACELKIWNLSESSRAAVEDTAIPVIIEAGYNKQHEILFRGKLRKGASARVGADWVTTLTAGDGDAAYTASRVNESFAPGTSIKHAAKVLARKLGVSIADAEAKIDGAAHRLGLTEYTNGRVMQGRARDFLAQILTDHGLEWSIQDEAMQVLERGLATNQEAVVLSARTGLVGSPAPGTKGLVKVTALLQPAIRPGRKIKLDASSLAGFYRVESVSHYGDTHAQPWYTEAEALPL